jgi:site-specific recombinase XerD
VAQGPRPRASRKPIPTRYLDSGANELHWLAFDRTLRSRNRSDLTSLTYRQHLADLAAFADGADLAELTRADIQRYLANRLERLSAVTVAIRYRSLRAFYNWAEAEEIVMRSPMRGMSEPKAVDTPPAVLDDADLVALLKACAGTGFEDRRDTAILRLFNEPGSPRVAEMAGILIEDLDMRRDRVTVHGKGAKTRIVPFGAKAGMALDRYLRVRNRHSLREAPQLWLGARKTVFTASGITQMLARRAELAGIGHVHPHQLRHTAAHAWADSDGSESDAMELFGWSSPEMPRRYGRAAATSRAHRAARRKSLGDRL